MNEKTQAERNPPRVVGRAGATLMSINGMVGAGIFALPALLHAEVGVFAPWLFLIFGLFFACETLISARLSSMFRSSGGPQLWVQSAFGPLPGFLAGWVMLLVMAAGRAATLYVLVAYLAVLFPALLEPFARGLALAFLVLALTVLTVSGMKRSVDALALGALLKLTPIALLCLFAYASGGISPSYTLPDFGAFESVALLVFFAFSGANSSTYSAGELKNPQRDLPLTMLGSLALVIALYMAVQWAFIAAGAPQSDGDATPLAATAKVVMGETGVIILSLAAIFSIAANALNFYIAGARLAYGMASRGLLPKTFTHISPRFQTPDRAILLFSTVVAIMLASGVFAFLASVTSLGAQAVALVVFGAFVVLMRRSNSSPEGRLHFAWWPIIMVGIFFALFSIAQASLSAFVLFAILMAVGVSLYFFARPKGADNQDTEFDELV